MTVRLLLQSSIEKNLQFFLSIQENSIEKLEGRGYINKRILILVYFDQSSE